MLGKNSIDIAHPSLLCMQILISKQISSAKIQLLYYFQKSINEHRATLRKDQPRDYIDAFLIEQEDRKAKGEDNVFTGEVKQINDLYRPIIGNLIQVPTQYISTYFETF